MSGNGSVLHRFHRTKAVSPVCERYVKDIGFRSASHRSLSNSASRGFSVAASLQSRNLRNLDVLGQAGVLLEDSSPLFNCQASDFDGFESFSILFSVVGPIGICSS